jgi:hypothetical protein
MTAKKFNTGEKENCSGYELDELARLFNQKYPGKTYAECVACILANDPVIAKKYMKQTDEPKTATDGAIIPKSYENAVQVLTDAAELFSLQYKIPMDLAFKRTICRPEMRLCARSYLSQVHKAKKT